MEFEARRCDTAIEALQVADIYGGHAIICCGAGHLVVGDEALRKLEQARVSFAHIHWHEPSGRIVTVPVNGGGP